MMEPTQQPKDSNYGKGAALLGLGALGLAAAPALRKIAGKAYLDHAENSAKVTAKEMFSLLDESGLRNNLKIKKSPGVSSSYSPEESVLRFPMKGNRPQVPVGTVAHELGHASIDKGLLNPFSKAIQDVRPSIMKMAGRLGDLTGGNRERGRGIMGAITGSAGAIAGAVMGSNPITAGIGGMIGGALPHIPTLINEADASIQGFKLMRRAGMDASDAASMMGKAYASYIPQAIDGVSQGLRSAGVGTVAVQGAKDIREYLGQKQ